MVTNKSYDEIQTIVIENIKKYRKAKYISQEKLGELSNLHRTYIGAVERKEKNITLKALTQIANALNIKLVDFLK